MADAPNAQSGEQKTTPKTFTEEDVQKLIETAVETATTGLKKKNDELIGEKKAAKTKAEEAEAERQRIANEAAKKSGDVEALEASWSKKFEDLEANYQAEKAPLLATIEKLTVGAAATQIANRIAIDPDAAVNISDYLRTRLRLDMDDGKTNIQVLDGEGRASATTLKELEQQVAELPRFKHVVKGNEAQGGGAAGANGGAVNSKNRSEMSANEKRQYQQKHGQQAYLALPK